MVLFENNFSFQSIVLLDSAEKYIDSYGFFFDQEILILEWTIFIEIFYLKGISYATDII